MLGQSFPHRLSCDLQTFDPDQIGNQEGFFFQRIGQVKHQIHILQGILALAGSEFSAGPQFQSRDDAFDSLEVRYPDSPGILQIINHGVL